MGNFLQSSILFSWGKVNGMFLQMCKGKHRPPLMADVDYNTVCTKKEEINQIC